MAKGGEVMAKRTLRRRGNETQDGPTAKQVTDSARDNRSMSMGSEPSQEDIRLRAYERYVDRGGAHGAEVEDWLAAERELRNRK
jgi:hypothetical protein